MAKNPNDVLERYIVESMAAGRWLSTADLNGRDDVPFGEGPVYTHWGGMDEMRFDAMVACGMWTERDWEGVLEEYDALDRGDVERLRRAVP